MVAVQELNAVLERDYEPELRFAIARYVGSRIADREAAQDVAADVFVSAVRKASQLRDIRSLRAWLFGIARNAVTSHYRGEAKRRARHTRLLEAVIPKSDDPIGAFLDGESCAVLVAALGDCSPRQREAVGLRERGYSTAEIAEIMRTTEVSVRVAVYRAKLKVKAALEA